MLVVVVVVVIDVSCDKKLAEFIKMLGSARSERARCDELRG